MLKKWKIISIVAALFLVSISVWFVSSSFTGKSVKLDPSGLPEFALKDSKTAHAYKYALEFGDKFEYIACYCGCGTHEMMHRGKIVPKMSSLKECFVRDDGAFEDHAALDCPACVTLALETADMIKSDKPLREIRNTIDRRYGIPGVGTNTPYPL